MSALETEPTPKKRGRPRKDRPDGAIQGGILRWYEAHRGPHRCMDVAAAMADELLAAGVPEERHTQTVAVVSRRLAERTPPQIRRIEKQQEGRQTPIPLYGVWFDDETQQ